MSSNFDEVTCRGFKTPYGVFNVLRRDVVGHHDVLGHHVTSVFDDVVEDRTSTGAESAQPDRHGGLVQLEQLCRIWHVRFCETKVVG